MIGGPMDERELRQRSCVPCEGGVPALSDEQVARLLRDVVGWRLREGRLTRTWDCGNFARALERACEVGNLADAEGHHPEVHITEFKHLRLDLWTHAIDGLSMNDFILASKINALWPERDAAEAQA